MEECWKLNTLELENFQDIKSNQEISDLDTGILKFLPHRSSRDPWQAYIASDTVIHFDADASVTPILQNSVLSFNLYDVLKRDFIEKSNEMRWRYLPLLKE